MNQIFKRSIKRIGQALLTGVMTIQIVQQTITLVQAYTNTSGALGTASQLGSPLLNNQFNADNFNPWEQIVFGIYLSNYVQPFVDSYESAFSTGAGYGSNGAGAQSLQFSAGEEATNEEIIKGMLNIIINMQANVPLKPLYVTYNDLTGGKITRSSVISQGQKSDSTDTTQTDGTEGTDAQTEGTEGTDTQAEGGFQVSADVQAATLADLFLTAPEKGSGAYMDVADKLKKGDSAIHADFLFAALQAKQVQNMGDKKMLYAADGSIPTIVLMNQSNTGYKEIILDYCDSYDIQQFAALAVKAAQVGDSYESSFWDSIEGFDELDSDGLNSKLMEYPLYLDCFGNIVVKQTDGKVYMVYPSCVNQHLTKEREVNLVNSIIMNGVQTSTDGNSYVQYAGVLKNVGFMTGQFAGTPQFNNGSQKVPTGSIAVYYDTDGYIGKTLLQDGQEVNWGQALKAVFQAKLGSQNNQVPLKIQVVNPNKTSGIDLKKYTGTDNIYKRIINQAQVFQNQTSNNNTKVNDKLQMLYNSKETQSIFGEAVAIPIMTKESENNATYVTAFRQFVNYVYQQYNTNESLRSEIDQILSSSTSRNDIRSQITTTSDNHPTNIVLSYWTSKAGNSGYWTQIKADAKSATPLSGAVSGAAAGAQASFPLTILPTAWKTSSGEKVSEKNNLQGTVQDADMTHFGGTDDELFGSTAVVFTASNILSPVSDALNLKGGADFETYATDVYYTYLKFYGILNDYGVANEASNLNPNIFDESLVSDLTKINELLGDGSYMTQEQKLSAILDGTYTLLQQSLDRDYNITDFIYNQYYKLVFGRAQQTTVSNNIQTRSANGFLQIHTYSENFLTAFFIEGYARYCAFLMIFIVVFLIILGVLRGKNFGWFFGNVLLAANLVLLMPSIGEITPYICNTIIENAFQNSMQFWSISETLNNYNVDTGLGEFSGLSGEELEDAVNIYKSHAALNLDHTLMLKLDISKKVMTTDQTDYTALQQLQTTRWLLPMILQEWQAQDGSYDYVQVTLSSEVDNMQNMYWQYKPSDAQNVTTVAAGKVNSSEFNTDWDTDSIDITKVSSLTGKFAGYDEIEQFDRTVNDPTVISRSILYTKNPEIKDRPSNYFYILDETYPLSVVRTVGEDGKTDWDTWYQQTLQSTTGDFNAAYDSVAQKAQQYVQADPNTVDQSYGYLWTTQNPLYYFYFVTKEQMNSDYVLNDVYNVLQGDYVLNAKTGDKDLRRSDLMYIAIKADENGENLEADTRLTQYGLPIGDSQADITSEDLATEDTQTEDTSGETSEESGETSEDDGTLTDNQTSGSGYAYQASRDVLDLNHLFTNVVPYLYEMTLASGGTGDGADGFFTDEDLIGQEYQVYEGNLKSWLFRSNWAIKIVENPTYNKEQTIRDAEGNKYKITQTWDPSAYPAERPMVFSRAQQILQGLDDSDLTTFELKCIQANEEVCDEWTKLINYLNLDDMTPEVMYREMALVALLKFNQVFSPQTFTGSNYVLYPYTMDIRYISFDSIMRMLMLNVSKNTQYIYNDTMQTVIKDSDVFTAVLLLLAALLCSGVIPFLRDILMAFVFYLGFIQLIRAIFRQSKVKIQIQTGIVICNLAIQLMTTVYYWTFQAMMGVTTYDAVLDLGQAAITTGTPLWCFLFVIIVSIVYIVVLVKTGIFIWRNKDDMGFEAFAEMARNATEKFNNFAESVGSKIQNFFGGDESTQSSARSKDMSGSGEGTSQPVTNNNNTENVQIVGDSQKRKQDDDEDVKEYDQGNYQFNNGEVENKDFDDSKQIDAEIDKGKEMDESGS